MPSTRRPHLTAALEKAEVDTHSQELRLPDLARGCNPAPPGHLFFLLRWILAAYLAGAPEIHLAREAGLLRRSGPGGRYPRMPTILIQSLALRQLSLAIYTFAAETRLPILTIPGPKRYCPF